METNHFIPLWGNNSKGLLPLVEVRGEEEKGFICVCQAGSEVSHPFEQQSYDVGVGMPFTQVRKLRFRQETRPK